MENTKMLFGTVISTSGMVDLRSDVITLPSKGMLLAMLKADVGNDGWKEDPTVNAFEKRITSMLKMEAGIILPGYTEENSLLIYVNLHL